MFKEFYKDFFPNIGKLQKVITPATWTGAWFAEMFYGKVMKDTIFISSVRWINSEGPSDERVRVFSERLKYGKMIRELDATKIFQDIIDVWKFGYDEKIRSISPEIMTDETIKALEKNPKSRVITKYLQIHEPYIFYAKDELVKKNKVSFENLQNFFGYIISDEVLCKLREMTGRLPINALSYYYLKYGREGILKGYREDLKTMLNYTKKIVDKFPEKRVAITSDHGERLGEGGDYGHSGQRDNVIIEVPWLEIPARKKSK
jgi:hypothetical protein